jgi:hypothetical protein
VRGTIGVLGVAGVFFGFGVVTAAGVACGRRWISLHEPHGGEHSLATTTPAT